MNYETVIIGENYFSYLLALRCLGQGQNVCIISDPRIQLGHQFLGQIGDCEVQFLKAWGDLYQLKSLLHIEQLLRPTPYTITLDKTIILLGQDLKQNTRELYRKLPDFFYFNIEKTDQLNSDFYNFLKWLSYYFLEKYFDQRTDEKFLESKLPQEIKDFRNRILIRNHSDNAPLDTFYQRFLTFTFRSLFQYQLNETGTKFELLHLVLSLLGQRYELNYRKLSEELKKEFINRGGRVLSAQVKEFVSAKQSHQILQLDGEFSQVTSRKIFFVGCPVFNLSIFPINSSHRYLAFSLVINFKKDLPDSFQYPGLAIYQTHFGPDVPFFYFKKEGPRSITLIFPYLDKATTKFSFYTGPAKAYFKNWAQHFCGDPELFEDIQESQVISQNEAWVENFGPVHDHWNISAYSSSRVVKMQKPGAEEKIQGIEFLGPLKNYNLGHLGLLTDLKSLVNESSV